MSFSLRLRGRASPNGQRRWCTLLCIVLAASQSGETAGLWHPAVCSLHAVSVPGRSASTQHPYCLLRPQASQNDGDSQHWRGQPGRRLLQIQNAEASGQGACLAAVCRWCGVDRPAIGHPRSLPYCLQYRISVIVCFSGRAVRAFNKQVPADNVVRAADCPLTTLADRCCCAVQIQGRGNGIKTEVVNNVDIAKALERPPDCEPRSACTLWPVLPALCVLCSLQPSAC